MIDQNFHMMVISRADHRILSADYEATVFLGHDLFSKLDAYIDEKDEAAVEKHLREGDTSWFVVRFLMGQTRELCCMRVQESADADYIRLLFVEVRGLVENSAAVSRNLETSEMLLQFYDDIFFEYDPATGRVSVRNGEGSVYGTGVWTYDEWIRKMLSLVPEDTDEGNDSAEARAQVMNFAENLTRGSGYFRIEVKADLANDPPAVPATVLTGRRISHYDGTDTMGGIIHRVRRRQESSLPESGFQRDSLTGLVGRKDIIQLAQERIRSRTRERTTLVMTDIDYFKNVNDTFGHRRGDEVIRQVASIINAVIGGHGVAGRYGGDEFLIVLYDVPDEETLRGYCRNIRQDVRNAFPDLWGDSPLSLSMGSATFPFDADNYDDLFMLADYCLYQAKYKGRNRYIIYMPAKHGTLAEIREKNAIHHGFRDERDTTPGDTLIRMQYRLHYGEKPELQEILNEFASVFDVDNMALMVGDPLKVRYTMGRRMLASAGVREQTEKAAGKICGRLMADTDFLVLNQLVSLPQDLQDVSDFLEEHGILSLLAVRFRDAKDRTALLFLTSVGRTIQWNETYFPYYRVFTDILAEYDVAGTQQGPEK